MCLSYIMGYGRAVLLSDYPDTGGNPATVADLRSGRIAPKLLLCSPNSIINWRTKHVGSRNLLSLVVIHETYSDVRDPFETRFGDQWRVLKLIEIDGPQHYHIEIWRSAVKQQGKATGKEKGRE